MSKEYDDRKEVFEDILKSQYKLHIDFYDKTIATFDKLNHLCKEDNTEIWYDWFFLIGGLCIIVTIFIFFMQGLLS